MVCGEGNGGGGLTYGAMCRDSVGTVIDALAVAAGVYAPIGWTRWGTIQVQTSQHPHKPRWVWRTLVLLVAIHGGMLGYGAWVHSPSFDEIGHLAAGLSHWRFGDFRLYRVNPPLVRLVATTPLLCSPPSLDWDGVRVDEHERSEFDVGRLILFHQRERRCSSGLGDFTLARWAVLPFSAVGALLCFVWARRLYCDAAGLLAAGVWCFSPMTGACANDHTRYRCGRRWAGGTLRLLAVANSADG